jgi:type IV pilus assembly protein PilA
LVRRRLTMRIPERGEKGFTLIELLIVVAILGVLAAVVIPNVGRFIGRGEEEAKDTEFANVQSAVVSMMVDNNLSTLPNPLSTTTDATQNMATFPDNLSGPTTDGDSNGVMDKLHDPYGGTYEAGDKLGYILYNHDITGDNGQSSLVNYVATANTTCWYTCDAAGTITQYDTDPTP